jgi:hypothetical protein
MTSAICLKGTPSSANQQRTIGALEGFAECLDGAPVGGAVLGEFREIMVEGRVDHGVRLSRTALQAFEIIERAVMGFSAGRRQLICSFLRAGEAQHLVPGSDQFIDDGPSRPSRWLQ